MNSAPIAYPGADTIRKIIGKSLQSPVKAFVELTPPAAATAQATAAATDQATDQATAAATDTK